MAQGLNCFFIGCKDRDYFSFEKFSWYCSSTEMGLREMLLISFPLAASIGKTSTVLVDCAIHCCTTGHPRVFIIDKFFYGAHFMSLGKDGKG